MRDLTQKSLYSRTTTSGSERCLSYECPQSAPESLQEVSRDFWRNNSVQLFCEPADVRGAALHAPDL